jgi:hypothetical protein
MMVRRLVVAAFGLLGALLSSTASSNALAAGPTTAPSPSPSPSPSASPTPSSSASPNGGGAESQRDYARASLEDLANEGEHRSMTLEISPLATLIGQFGGTIEILPMRHHALALSPYFYWTRSEYQAADGSTLGNTFTGGGLEVGYRYYTGNAGPRGMFLGPSLLLGAFTGKGEGQSGQPDPAAVTFYNLGMAIDVGYQAVIGDDWLVGVGGGAQVMYVTKSLPDQGWPTSVHTRSLVYPRLLFSIGYAFN